MDDHCITAVLGREKLAAFMVFSHEGFKALAETLELEASPYYSFGREMAVRLTAYCAAGKTHSQVETTVLVPKDWWQAVRERWAPAWWLRRYPVMFREIPTNVAVRHLCPHLDTATRPHVEWLMQRPEEAQ